MKRLLLAAALLAGAARAESAPSEEAKAGIMRAVRAGMAAKEAMRVAVLARDAAPSPESALLDWTAARTAQSEMKANFDLAIRLTQDAYSVKPETPTEPRAAKPLSADGAWSDGLSAPWAPEYGPPGHREIRGSDGLLHYLSNDPQDGPEPKAVVAFTNPDGKVTIMPAIFTSILDNEEPGLLASTLHHEARHYMELITTGWDAHEQLEIRANRASLGMIDDFMPGLPAEVRRQMKAAFMKQIADDEALVASGGTHSAFPNPKQEENYEKMFRLQERREFEYQDLVRHVERRGRDLRESLEASRRGLRWAKFNLWTLNSCVYIVGTTPGSPEWGRPDLIRVRDQKLQSYLRGNLVVLPSDEIDAGLARGDTYGGDSSIARCQDRMIRMIRDLPSPVDADWMMDRIEYERRGGRTGEIISGVIESVRRAVADGTAALVTAVSPGVATRGPGEQPVRDPSGGDRGSRLPGGYNPPMEQARGISTGKPWD